MGLTEQWLHNFYGNFFKIPTRTCLLCVYDYSCVPKSICRDQRITRGSLLSPSTTWVPEMKLNIRFGGRCLYSWSHLSGPVLEFQPWLSTWLPSTSLDCMRDSLASLTSARCLLDRQPLLWASHLRSTLRSLNTHKCQVRRSRIRE